MGEEDQVRKSRTTGERKGRKKGNVEEECSQFAMLKHKSCTASRFKPPTSQREVSDHGRDSQRAPARAHADGRRLVVVATGGARLGGLRGGARGAAGGGLGLLLEGGVPAVDDKVEGVVVVDGKVAAVDLRVVAAVAVDVARVAPRGNLGGVGLAGGRVVAAEELVWG